MKVALELRRVGRLAHEIQFIDDCLFVLGDDFERAQALAVLPVLGGEARNPAKYIEDLLDLIFDTGPQYFDDHFSAIGYLRRMHLCD